MIQIQEGVCLNHAFILTFYHTVYLNVLAVSNHPNTISHCTWLTNRLFFVTVFSEILPAIHEKKASLKAGSQGWTCESYGVQSAWKLWNKTTDN